MDPVTILIIAGLGNPGQRYARNRHNIGFMAVEAIARAARATPWRSRFQGYACEATIGGEKALLLLPQTYMNESGRAIGEAARFFKVAPADVVVFHDELDLAPAKLRVKLGGGNAGHNGLRSITAHCGNDYRRVRMGIGHPGHKDLVHGHEADSVPVAGIARAGIAEAGEDQHGGTPAGLSLHSKTAGAGPAVS